MPVASTWRSTGTTAEQFQKIGYKNHKHSVNNPYSQFQDEYTLQEIKDAPMVYDPLTKLCCCPTSDGAGAAILCSEDFMKKHNLQDRAVEILGMSMATDFEDTFDSMAGLCGYTLSQAAVSERVRAVGSRPGGPGCHRAARLLRHQRDALLRGPGSVSGGQGR